MFPKQKQNVPYYPENNPTLEISRDFEEKSKNDSSKTAETPKITRKSQKIRNNPWLFSG